MISLLSALALVQSFQLLAGQTSASPVRLDARQAQACPSGSTWTSITESFDALNQTLWSLDNGTGAAFGRQGASFTVTEQQTSTVMQSIVKFAVPVKMSVDIKTSATPGVASAIFFGALDGGEEIDLELCKQQFQLPIWKKGTSKAERIKKSGDGSAEVTQVLSGGTVEKTNLIEEYGYQYEGFRANQWNTYSLDWQPNSIAWSIGGTERVHFTKNSVLPAGPLPIRLGPWATGAKWWCGTADWAKNPQAKMEIRRLVIEGCMTS